MKRPASAPASRGNWAAKVRRVGDSTPRVSMKRPAAAHASAITGSAKQRRMDDEGEYNDFDLRLAQRTLLGWKEMQDKLSARSKKKNV